MRGLSDTSFVVSFGCVSLMSFCFGYVSLVGGLVIARV